MVYRILVPIDGSEYAYKALDWALNLAEMYSADIELVTVIPTVYAFFGLSEKDVQERAELILKETLNKTKTSKPNLTISTKILVGRPAEKIVEASKEGNFDLIVIGSRGLGGVTEFLLGSVADRVADLAQCPVVIVK